MPFPEGAQRDAPPTDLDRLRVALALQVAREIADADGVLDVSEVQLLASAFPTHWLRRCGFLDDDDQLTPTVDRFRERAFRELPRRLDLDQKLELIALFHATCIADGQLHPAELEILTDAARRLHIPVADFRAHLSRLRQQPSAPPVRDHR